MARGKLLIEATGKDITLSRLKTLEDQVEARKDLISKSEDVVENLEKEIADLLPKVDLTQNPPPSEKESKAVQAEWGENYRSDWNSIADKEEDLRSARDTLSSREANQETDKKEIDLIKKLRLKGNLMLYGAKRKEYESRVESQKLAKVTAKAKPTMKLLRLGSKDFFGKVENPITKDNVEELIKTISLWENNQDEWNKKFPGVRYPSNEIEAAKKRLWEFESFKQS